MFCNFARSQMDESLFCVRVTASVRVRSKNLAWSCIRIRFRPRLQLPMYFSEHSFAVQEFNGRHAQFLLSSHRFRRLLNSATAVLSSRIDAHSRLAATDRPQRVFAFPQDVYLFILFIYTWNQHIKPHKTVYTMDIKNMFLWYDNVVSQASKACPEMSNYNIDNFSPQ